MTFRVSIEFQGTLLLHMAYGNFPCSLQRNNMQKASYKRYDLHHPHHLSAEIRTLEVVERALWNMIGVVERNIFSYIDITT